MFKLELIKTFLQQASVRGSRSSVLKPIGWMMTILISAIFIAFLIEAPLFILWVFTIFCLFTMMLYLFAYLYFMFKNPDALRSERYSLEKLAIEKGLIGDNLHGVFEPKEVPKLEVDESSADRKKNEK